MLIVIRPSYSGQRRTDFKLRFSLEEINGQRQIYALFWTKIGCFDRNNELEIFFPPQEHHLTKSDEIKEGYLSVY